MARPVTITKDKILAAALNVVRREGASALTARNLCAALGCGANAVFSSFGSIKGVREAVREEAKQLYQRRVGAGFSLHPPFKGFGLAFIWFAMDEPQLFKMVMEGTTLESTFEAYIDAHVGFKAECIAAITQSFGLQGEEAETLYYQMILVAIGLAHTCVEGGASLHLDQVSAILGKNARAHLMAIHAGADKREGYMPSAETGPAGEIGTYAGVRMEDALMGQNHLLRELHASPRYIRDSEWVELERVFRNASSVTIETLRDKCSGLTHGDLRALILGRLQFSVAEQAVLLGISPASVTKARQRLKNKLKEEPFIGTVFPE